MLTTLKVGRVVLAGAVILSFVLTSGGSVSARPKYKAAADEAYADLAKAKGTDNKFTCSLCHPVKDKKVRNNYGAAFGKHLEKKNETDDAKLKEALKATEKDNSATEGKTFGDLITAGELPGTDKAAE
ncbi:MAG: hypothetical protein ACK526_05155 [Planctomyces sp.]